MASIDLQFQYTLSYLMKLEDGSDHRMKDIVKKFKLMISILRSFLRCTLKWHIKHENLEGFLKHISYVLEKVIGDFQSPESNSAGVAGKEDWESAALNLEHVVSNLLKLKHIKEDMEEVYSVISKSSRSVAFESDENVVSFITSLVGNVKDILSCKASVIVTMKEQLEELEQKLRFLRNFLLFIANRCMELDRFEDLLTYAEVVAVNAACLLYFCLVDDEMDQNMVSELKIEVSDLLEKIKPSLPEGREIYIGALKASQSCRRSAFTMDDQVLDFVDSLIDVLTEMFKSRATFMVTENARIGILLEELRFVRCNLMDPPSKASTEQLKGLVILIEHVINETGYFVCLSCNNEKNEEISGELNFVLSGLLRILKRIRRKARDLYDQFIPISVQSMFPRTNQMGFINFLIQNLNDLLQCKADSVQLFSHQIETVHEELLLLINDFCKVAEQLNENEELKAQLIRINDVAHLTEFLIHSMVAKAGSLWCYKLGLFHVTKEINLIQKAVTMRKKMTNDGAVQNITTIPSHVLLQANPPNDEARKRREISFNQLVGFEDEAKKIIEHHLTGGSAQLRTLSIVGMPGLGKTTLANSVYMDSSVGYHFHVRAWCCVSQVYKKETLLREILDQVFGQVNKSLNINREILVEKVYRSLKGKRYLIIVDDIWEIRAWNDLKECFPDDRNGSRILFTTRYHAVAAQANSLCHALRQLSVDESLKLFQSKLFDDGSSPPELLEVGHKIAKNCKGLPLAVVVMAGVLKTKERKPDCWEEVSKISWSHDFSDPSGPYLGMLELSYTHLPNYLKPCFLYFGTFREDAVIPVSKLLWFWIAEGFIHLQNPGQRSLENEAEICLRDLIDRSLVMVVQRSSKGGVKSCRVHDVLHYFCLVKAQEENFLWHVKKYRGLYTSTGSVKHQAYRLCADSNEQVSWYMNKHVVSQYPKEHVVSPGTLCTRSLLISFRFHGRLLDYILQFRLLRVLDMVFVRSNIGLKIVDFINITKLVHLRFLAIPICHPEVPSEIMSLQNLETLIVNMKSHSYVGIKLPMTIWSLVRLRHLCAGNGNFFCLRSKSFDNSYRLHNLETLSAAEFFRGNHFEEVTAQLPSIRKLACLFNKVWVPLIINLSQVETLKISFDSLGLSSIKFNSPNLKKLTLHSYGRPWDEISIIGELPNLEVLKLVNAFKGRQWNMKEGEFLKLKVLKLCYLDVAVWNASSEHLPCLERLVVESCKHLEEVPSTLGETSTLQMIKMKQCSSSAEESVWQILNEQHEMGNYELNVSVL